MIRKAKKMEDACQVARVNKKKHDQLNDETCD